MSDKLAQLIKIRPKGGLVADITPGEVDPNFWTRGANVTFRSGSAQRADGYSKVFATVPVVPMHVRYVQYGDILFWVICGLDSVHVWNGASWSDITPAALVACESPDDWTSCTLNGIPVFNNGKSAPFYWPLDVGQICLPLPGWPSGDLAGSIAAFQFHLFAFNLVRGGQIMQDLVVWSDAAPPGSVPGEWVPTAENQAGDTQLSDTPGAIIDAASLRGNLIIYKQSSCHVAQYVGGQFVYAFRKLFGVGVMARNCIVQWRNQHLFASLGDVMVTDGANLTSAIDNKIRDHVFDGIDGGNYRQGFMVHNPYHNEVIFSYPTQEGGNVEAATFDYQEGSWGLRTLPPVYHGSPGFIEATGTAAQTWATNPHTWASDSDLWNAGGATSAPANFRVLLGADGPDLIALATSGSASGEPIECEIIRDALDFGHPDARKLLKRLWPRTRAGTGETLYVSTWGSDDPGQAPQWGPEQPFVIGSDAWVSSFTAGQYISIRFRSLGTQVYRLDGFDADISLQGVF